MAWQNWLLLKNKFREELKFYHEMYLYSIDGVNKHSADVNHRRSADATGRAPHKSYQENKNPYDGTHRGPTRRDFAERGMGGTILTGLINPEKRYDPRTRHRVGDQS